MAVFDVSSFEQAVMCASQPGGPRFREATAYVQTITASADGWARCVQLFVASAQASVQFFALGKMQETLAGPRWASFSDAARRKQRMMLLEFVHGAARPNSPTLPLTNGHGGASSSSSPTPLPSTRLEALPVYVQNKLAVVVVLLVKNDYPERWPSAFEDLHNLFVAPGQGGALDALRMRLWLRVLCYFDEEVVRFDIHRSKPECAHNTVIKDTMRAHTVGRIVETWYSILTTYQRSAPDLCKECLHCMMFYIGWIDLRYIANDRVLPTIIAMTRVPGLRANACQCLQELVNKGMDEPSKAALLVRIRLGDVLRATIGSVRIVVAPPGPKTPADAAAAAELKFASNFAALTNAFGLALLRCLEALRAAPGGAYAELGAQVRAMLGTAMQLSLVVMNLDPVYLDPSGRPAPSAAAAAAAAGPGVAADDGSDEVCEVVGPVLELLLAIATASQKRQPWLAELDGAVLSSVLKRLCYPQGFHFDSLDDSEETFLQFRGRVMQVFSQIVRARPAVVLAFLRQQLAPGGPLPIDSLHAAPFGQVEAFLAGLNDIGVASRTSASAPAFVDLVVALHRSRVAHHPHHQVVLAYFLLTVRYHSILRGSGRDPRLLQGVLQTLLSDRGLRHAHRTVRARSCYLLLRLVRSLGDSAKPYAEHLLQAIQATGALSIPHGPEKDDAPLRFSEQLHLFETVGFVVGARWMPRDAQSRFARAVAGPMIHSLDAEASRLVPGRIPAEVLHPFGLGLWASRTLNALAHLTKGFLRTSVSAEIKALFKAVLNSSLGILEKLPGHVQLRQKTITLLHRMLDTLETEALPFMPRALRVFLEHACDQNHFDTLEMLQLLTQLVNKFGPAARENRFQAVLDAPLVNIIKRVFETLPHLTDDPGVERNLRRQYFTFLKDVVEYMPYLFYSPTNVPHLASILDTVLQGCTLAPDITKACFQIFRGLVENWLAPLNGTHRQVGLTPQTQAAFGSFVFQKVTVAIFQSPAQPHFDLKDAKCSTALTEIAATVKAIVKHCGDKYIPYLMTVYLPSIACPAEAARAFCEHAQSDDTKKLKKFLLVWLAQLQPTAVR